MGETPVDSRLSLNSHVCRILQKRYNFAFRDSKIYKFVTFKLLEGKFVGKEKLDFLVLWKIYKKYCRTAASVKIKII